MPDDAPVKAGGRQLLSEAREMIGEIALDQLRQVLRAGSLIIRPRRQGKIGELALDRLQR